MRAFFVRNGFQAFFLILPGFLVRQLVDPCASSSFQPGTMAELQGRKVFKVFGQDFIVGDRYNVTKELGQGAYGIVW